MLTQLQLPTRIRLWSTLLALLSLEDLALTALALYGMPTAREINPLARIAFDHGLALATILKVVGTTIALITGTYLAKHGHAARVEKTLAAWSAIFLGLNTVSVLVLVGGT
jgi:hypothetical protein